MSRRISFLLLLLFCFNLNAQLSFEHKPHLKHQMERWLLTGIVSDEKGLQYGYAFLVDRHGKQLAALSQIIKLKSNTMVFSEEGAIALEKDDEELNWRIGKEFIKYNPINESWVFGSKQPQGFNLRFEGINEKRKNSETIQSIAGMQFFSLLSNRTNGSLVVDNKDLFVTSKNAWIYHQWLNASKKDKTFLHMMCRFDDDTGLDYLKVYRNGDVIATNAEWLDAKGAALPVSQFSHLKKVKMNQWQLQLSTPNKTLTINTQPQISLKGSDELTSVETGSLQGDGKGFCVIVQDVFEHKMKHS